MVVDINLLPRTEQKSRIKLILWVLLIALFLIAVTIFWIQLEAAKSRNLSTEQQITSVEQLRVMEEKKLEEVNETTNADKLKHVVEWTETFPVPTVLFLRHVTGLLPERGFFVSYEATEDGTVHLEIQFDTTRQAAYYLNHLKGSEFIADVSVLSVESKEITPEEEVGQDELDVLPRYVASYQLKLNTTALQLAAEKEED